MSRSLDPADTVGIPTPNFSAFGILLALPPLYAGLIVGAAIDCAVYYRSDGSLWDDVTFLLIMGFGCVCMTLVLAGMSLGPGRQPLARRKWWVVALLSAAYSLIPMAVAALANFYWSEFPTTKPNFGIWFLVAFPIAFAMPLLMITRKRPSTHRRAGLRVALWAIGIIISIISYRAAWNVGIRFQSRKLNGDCAAVIAWVKSTHSAAGAYPQLSLPPPLAHLSTNGLVDAVVLKDGRVGLLFQAETPFLSYWRGFLYSSGPLTPSEVGLDHPDPWFLAHWGYPQLTIDGLPGGCIYNVFNSQEYLVGMDN